MEQRYSAVCGYVFVPQMGENWSLTIFRKKLKRKCRNRRRQRYFPKTVKPRRICSSTVCMWNNTGMPLIIPEDYYLEGLRRDPTDIRLNNVYGRCLLKKCDFAGAEKYFRKAVEKSIRSNPNPYDYEPYYIWDFP